MAVAQRDSKETALHAVMCVKDAPTTHASRRSAAPTAMLELPVDPARMVMWAMADSAESSYNAAKIPATKESHAQKRKMV